jgi:hypothetical protein
MTHEELVAKRERYTQIPFDAYANAKKIRETGRDLWGQRALLTEAQVAAMRER